MAGEQHSPATGSLLPRTRAHDDDDQHAHQNHDAATDQELEVGLCAVAAPVRGRDAGVVAAVGAHGPSARMSPQLDQVGQLLVDSAEKISALLLRRTRKEGAA